MAEWTEEDEKRMKAAEQKAVPSARPASMWDNLVNAFEQGTLNPLGAAGVFRVRSALGGGMGAYARPKEEVDKIIGARRARVEAFNKRQDAAFANTDTLSAPNIGRRALDVAGNMVGGIDPSYPFGAGASRAARILSQGAINAGADAVGQGIEMLTGDREEFDPKQTGINAAAGVALQGAGEYLVPAKGKLTSDFGQRRAPKAGASTNHGGVDIAGRRGTPIVAQASGTVIRTVRGDKKAGNYVVVAHGDGLESSYLHLDGFNVKEGDVVTRGKPFARMGATGNVTGSHLHWAVKKDGKPVDPLSVTFREDMKGAPDGQELAPSASPDAPRVDPDAAGLDDLAESIVNDATMAPDGLPGNGSVRPIDPEELRRIMGEQPDIEAPQMIGDLPASGLAPAIRLDDGSTHVGVQGRTHKEVLDRLMDDGQDLNKMIDDGGFVTPQGEYLGRQDAYKWVEENEGRSIPPVGQNPAGQLEASEYARGIPEEPTAPDNVVNLDDMRTGKQDAENDKLIDDNLATADKIVRGIDQGIFTEAHVGHVQSAYDNMVNIRDEFGPDLTPDQAAKLDQNIASLSESAVRLGGPAPTPRGVNAVDEFLQGDPRMNAANDGDLGPTREEMDLQDLRDQNAPGFGDRNPRNNAPLPPRRSDEGHADEPADPDFSAKYAESINTNRLGVSDSAKNFIRAIRPDHEVDPVSHKATQERARDLLDEHDIEGVLNLEKIAPEDMPAYTVAVRGILAGASENIVKLSKLVLDPETSNPLRASELQDARVLAAAAYEKANGLSGIAGKLLNSMKIVVGNGRHGSAVGRMIKEMSGNDLDAIEVARLIEAHENQAAKIAADSLRPKASDYFFSLWYNLRLSGLTTQVANIAGTAGHILMDNVARTLSTLSPGKGRTELGEAEARAYGILIGMKQAVSRMEANGKTPVGTAFNLGTPLDMKSRVEQGRVFKGKFTGLVEIPTRTLAAVDEFWRNVGVMSDLYGQAFRNARAEGLEGDAFKARLLELTENPTREMEDSAVEYGRKMRFADKPSYWTSKLANARHVPVNPKTGKADMGDKTFAVMARAIFPFTWVLDRLTATTVSYSPLGSLTRTTRDAYKKGGGERDTAIAKQVMGTALMAAAYMAAANGDITGAGPKDYRKLAELQASGWRPYSIKIGDKYYSIKTLQPMSTILGIGATLSEQLSETGHNEKSELDKLFRVVKRVSGTALMGSWTESLSQFMQTTDPKSNSAFANWFGGFVNPMPNIVNQANQAYGDKFERDTTGDGSLVDRVKGRIQSTIPGLSDNLPKKHDTYGQEIVREGAAGPDIASPVKVTTEQRNEVIREIKRLSGKSKSAIINPPKREDMDAKKYQEFLEKSGKMFMSDLQDKILFDPEWHFMSEEEKTKVVKKSVSDARKAVKAEMTEAPGEAFFK